MPKSLSSPTPYVPCGSIMKAGTISGQSVSAFSNVSIGGCVSPATSPVTVSALSHYSSSTTGLLDELQICSLESPGASPTPSPTLSHVSTYISTAGPDDVLTTSVGSTAAAATVTNGQVLSHAMNGSTSHPQRPMSPPSYPPPPPLLHTGLQRQSRTSEGSESVTRESVVSGHTSISNTVPIAQFSEEEKKVSVIKAPHYEGIGPVDESGIPIAIRTAFHVLAFDSVVCFLGRSIHDRHAALQRRLTGQKIGTKLCSNRFTKFTKQMMTTLAHTMQHMLS
ncbi:hypothetical protein AMECASPLE_003815 [Ameca splendens]|uniref:SoHo domain-containing protein n=1 Tax=Ameca splendens TaxID=208324 RepID=A0ABV0ZIG2_9TELE